MSRSKKIAWVIYIAVVVVVSAFGIWVAINGEI